MITVAVRWYLRYGLSYRDVEELLAERGIEVDHVTVYRWVQRFVDVLHGHAHARGRLPFDLPSSTAAVVASRSDVAFDTADPVCRFGDGLQA